MFEPKDDFKNEIVTVITITGEIVGRYRGEKGHGYVIESPRAFVAHQGADGSDQGGLAPVVCASGDFEPNSMVVSKYGVVGIVKTREDVAKGWTQYTSGIVT